MSDTAESDGESKGYYPAGVVPTDSTDYSRFRIGQLRGLIAYLAGLNRGVSKSTLSKRTLNSVHAYLTGEFVVSPHAFNTSASPDIGTFRVKVADAAGIDYDWRHRVADDMEETDMEVLPEDEREPRAFRRDELVALIEEMRGMTDKREWTPGGGDGGE